ncbi:hypothetical protein GH714_036175 [Hevea brasiliensis]|uniref:Poly(A) RNA polymerase mitochondrial-like central palm domain-containing protein n=1 Tax=Hevea brasiliensis TaxID=3981 RepID=A0A6A6L904_HEVBR|nr:hypothetical protein GH714_036175 [Hevea brasiliensis]
MNGYNTLEPTLKDMLKVIKPLQEDWDVRSKIIEELKDVVTSVESLRGATVEPFGSFVSNLFTRWGDLDISIVLSNGSYISSTGKKRKQNLLGELLRALRQKGKFHRLQFVPSARVPILKFECGPKSISCDISVDNLHGQMKSKFLLWINQIDGRFRDMILLVKEWAKTHNINNSKAGTLNSYSLSLLVIFHFQTCVPAILPPLREIYPRNAVDDLTGVRTVAEERIKKICHANISRYMSDKYRAANRSSLSELFISFLAKFSNISTKAVKLGICTFTGQWQDMRSIMRWLPKTYPLFIEDPFERTENTARAVTVGNLERISEAFQSTYHRLVLDNHNRSSLFGILVRPQISNFIAGTSVGSSSRTLMEYRSTRQPVSRIVYSQSQVQHQIQNMSLERHPNYFSKKGESSQHFEQAKRGKSSQHFKVAGATSSSQHKTGNTSNYFAKQRQDRYPDYTRLEKHSNYFTRQRQDMYPDYKRLENITTNSPSRDKKLILTIQDRKNIPTNSPSKKGIHPQSSAKQSQESYPNYSTRQKHTRLYYGQGQHI